jgi:hypothetical protein
MVEHMAQVVLMAGWNLVQLHLRLTRYDLLATEAQLLARYLLDDSLLGRRGRCVDQII